MRRADWDLQFKLAVENEALLAEIADLWRKLDLALEDACQLRDNGFLKWRLAKLQAELDELRRPKPRKEVVTPRRLNQIEAEAREAAAFEEQRQQWVATLRERVDRIAERDRGYWKGVVLYRLSSTGHWERDDDTERPNQTRWRQATRRK